MSTAGRTGGVCLGAVFAKTRCRELWPVGPLVRGGTVGAAEETLARPSTSRATPSPLPSRLASSRSPLLVDGRRWRLGRGDDAAAGECRVDEISTLKRNLDLPF